MISFVIPTRNRPLELGSTLETLARQPLTHMGTEAEVIVVDNASEPPVRVPARLGNGMPVTLIRAPGNLGASARNTAAVTARNPWLVMLDDDSAPTDAPFTTVLPGLAADVAAVGGEILLPSGRREAGGLPEVVVGCGCALRRDAFLAAGGYDPSFGYYVEEYDLCAKLIAAGHRVIHTKRLRFEHRKVDAGRSFATIVRRLVRNNGWTIARYAPRDRRDETLEAMLAHYRLIAEREGVSDAFARAKAELDRTFGAQPRDPLSIAHWDRFTGADAVRSVLVPALLDAGVVAVRVVDRGKGVEVIERIVRASGLVVAEDASTAVVGTLSPGPLADAAARHGDRAPSLDRIPRKKRGKGQDADRAPDVQVTGDSQGDHRMSIAQTMIAELEKESKTTRRFLEQVPADKLGWKPHEKSLTAGQLALHIATIPGRIAEMAARDECPMPDFGRGFDQPETLDKVLAAHDSSVATAIDTLRTFDDKRMAGDWKLVANGEAMMTMPRVAFCRNVMLNHLYHHRGQLGVYLRLTGATVPSAYGPSADEMPEQFRKMVESMTAKA